MLCKLDFFMGICYDNKKADREKTMVVIWTDLNSINEEDGGYWISPAKAERFKLTDGMKIKLVDGDEMWDAVVHRTNSQNSNERWSAELTSEAVSLSEEEHKWLEIGISNGICVGKDIVARSFIQRMLELGYDRDEIGRIFGLSEETLL